MKETRTKIVAVCYDRVIKSAHESHLNSGRRQPVIEQLVNFGLLDNHAKYFIRGKDKWIFMGITGAPLVERSIIDLYYISREGLTRLYRWLIFYSPRACYISSLWVERSGNSLFQLVSLKSFFNQLSLHRPLQTRCLITLHWKTTIEETRTIRCIFAERTFIIFL